MTIACLLPVIIEAGPAATGDRHPVFATGDALRTWCLGRGTARASCLGYLAGVVDVLRAAGATGDRGTLCLPDRLPGEQVRLLFLNHLHRAPSGAGRGAAGLVRDALLEAFACGERPDRSPRDRGRERLSRGHGSAPV